jgi:hypothetical protein
MIFTWLQKIAAKTLRQTVESVYVRYQKNLSINYHTVDGAANADPSPDKRLALAYLDWIIKLAIYTKATADEESGMLNSRWLDTVYRLLAVYDKYKKAQKLKPEHKDINQFKDIESFEEAVSEYGDYTSKKYKVNEGEPGAEKVLQMGIYSVYELTKWEAAQKLLCGDNIKWCIRHKDAFEGYGIGPDHPAHLIMKHNQPYVLFGVHDNQCQHIDQSSINNNDAKELAPIFKQMYQRGLPVTFSGEFAPLRDVITETLSVEETSKWTEDAKFSFIKDYILYRDINKIIPLFSTNDFVSALTTLLEEDYYGLHGRLSRIPAEITDQIDFKQIEYNYYLKRVTKASYDIAGVPEAIQLMMPRDFVANAWLKAISLYPRLYRDIPDKISNLIPQEKMVAVWNEVVKQSPSMWTDIPAVFKTVVDKSPVIHYYSNQLAFNRGILYVPEDILDMLDQGQVFREWISLIKLSPEYYDKMPQKFKTKETISRLIPDWSAIVSKHIDELSRIPKDLQSLIPLQSIADGWQRGLKRDPFAWAEIPEEVRALIHKPIDPMIRYVFRHPSSSTVVDIINLVGKDAFINGIYEMLGDGDFLGLDLLHMFELFSGTKDAGYSSLAQEIVQRMPENVMDRLVRDVVNYSTQNIYGGKRGLWEIIRASGLMGDVIKREWAVKDLLEFFNKVQMNQRVFDMPIELVPFADQATQQAVSNDILRRWEDGTRANADLSPGEVELIPQEERDRVIKNWMDIVAGLPESWNRIPYYLKPYMPEASRVKAMEYFKSELQKDRFNYRYWAPSTQDEILQYLRQQGINEIEDLVQADFFGGKNKIGWLNKALHKKAEIRGEWFLDSDGNSTFADGDVGDVNHERAAMDSKVSEEIWMKYRCEDPEDLWRKYSEGEMEQEDIDDIGADFLEYMASGGEAREWMVQKEGWVRIHGNNFEVYALDGDTLDRIAGFIYEELGGADEETLSEEEIYIEEVSTRKTYDFNVAQLLNALDTNQVGSLLALRGKKYEDPRQEIGSDPNQLTFEHYKTQQLDALLNNVRLNVKAIFFPVVVQSIKDYNIDQQLNILKHLNTMLYELYQIQDLEEFSMKVNSVAYAVAWNKPIIASVSWMERCSQAKPMALPVEIPSDNKKGTGNRGIDYVDRVMSEETAQKEREKYPGMSFLDAGNRGVAITVPYTIQDESGNTKLVVMKYTTHPSEYKTAKFLLTRPDLNGKLFAKVIEADMAQGEAGQYEALYRIVMEKVDPLNKEEVNFINEFLYGNKGPNCPPINTLPMWAVEYTYVYDSYCELISNLKTSGFKTSDVHGKNVGWNEDSELVVFDLGYMM